MAFTTNRISIEYCVPCGYLPEAVQLSQELLQHLRMDIEALELVTGDSGVFDIRLNDEIIFSRFDEGRFPDAPEILAKVRERTKV